MFYPVKIISKFNNKIYVFIKKIKEFYMELALGGRLLLAFSLCVSITSCGGGGGGGGGGAIVAVDPIPVSASSVAVTSSSSGTILNASSSSLIISSSSLSISSVVSSKNSLSSSNSLKSSGSSKSSSSSSAYSGVVIFKDPVLSSAIHTALNFSVSSSVTTEDLKKLTSLQVAGKVTSLDGLQYATNLTEFLMYNDSVSPSTFDSVTPLASLKQLKKILFETGRFSDIDALKNLPLEFLEIFDLALLQNLNGLGGNTALKHLVVIRAPVSNIEALRDVAFVAGADVHLGTNCLTFAKQTSSLSVVSFLKSEGVNVSYNLEDNKKIGDVFCPQELSPVTPDPIVKNSKFIVTAKYNSAGTLKVDWFTSEAAFLGANNSCEIHAELEYQQARVPTKTMQNCAATGNLDITDLPFVGTRVSVIINTNTNTTPAVQLKSETAIDDSAIATTEPVIRAIDWGQVVIKTNPKLVRNRDALLRVHVTGSSPLPVPKVILGLSINGVADVFEMQKPAQLPSAKQFGSLVDAYTYVMPATWMKPGLKITLTLGNSVKTVTPTFADPAVLYLTVVPAVVQGLNPVVPALSDIQKNIMNNWPLAEIKIRTRAAYVSQVTSTDLNDLLSEMTDLHTLDQDQSHYFGFYNHNKVFSFGGLAHKPGINAVGLDSEITEVMPHELGHNFNLGHVDCGGPLGVDPAYPYDPTTMGSFALSFDFSRIFQPRLYADLMSYCSPKGTSDYSYEVAQDYINLFPSKPFTNTDTALFKKPIVETNRSLFISGQISRKDKVSLRRLVPLSRAAENIAPSAYELQVVNKNGETFTYAVELPQVDHPSLGQQQYFSAVIPYLDLASLSVLHNGKVIYSEFAAVDVNGAQQKSGSLPIITETLSSACLRWSMSGASATLIHQGSKGNTTLFMDNNSGNVCVPIQNFELGGQWKIILRKGISVQEFSQQR
jgi:hypothetical protein